MSIDDEVKYEVYCCAKENGRWGILIGKYDTGTHNSVQSARCAITKHKRVTRRDGIEFMYQIVKLTIKKEIIK
jgi:hypothetical protein